MTDKVHHLLQTLPAKPGVYLMKNNSGTIIYVGKAKDLSKRVSQYFLRPQSGKVHAMVQQIDTFETIITSNEKEALVLEMNLIHEHYPRYNIMLKEGSHYPYIALKKGKDPYLRIMRQNTDKKYHYFGPYPSSRSAYRMIALLNKIFPLRKCNVMPKAACLYFHIGQCLAPCIHDIPQDVYDELAQKITTFLKGDVKTVQMEYQRKMEDAIDSLQFENAREYKTILDDIVHIVDAQRVEIHDLIDRDMIAFSEREGYVGLAIFVFRRGILLGKGSFVVERFGELDEQLEQLLGQYYRQKPLPQQILLNHSSLATLLEETLGIDVIKVEKGNLFELLKLVQENAIQTLDDHFLTARLDDDKLTLLESLGLTLSIPTPYHIEMIDNSHLQGDQAVGALVVFINGEPIKKMYRTYHLSDQHRQDDPGAMKEVVLRRYSRLLKEKAKLPDLLIVDGGETQLQAASSALKELHVSIPVVGLFKNIKHQTKGLLNTEGEIFSLTDTPSVFFFLVRLQDEVHRFALGFHRRLRTKAMTQSIFDGIKGLGPTRRVLLEKRYPTLDGLKMAPLEELQQFLPDEVAFQLFEKLQSLKR
jgi:excinuclease ABC subunit C